MPCSNIQFVALLVAACAAVTGCGDSTGGASGNASTEATKPAGKSSPEITTGLKEVTAERGISFVHKAGKTGGYFFPQAVGSGAAFFDLEGDGDLDLFLLQGEITAGVNDELCALGTLYRQEHGRFEDVTAGSDLRGSGFGMGVAAGDFNNDGLPDLYVTKFGPDQLFLNRGNGAFSDITVAAGIENLGWSTAAAAADVNRDGWLDLVVLNYVEYVPGSFCRDGAGRQEFCGPKDFQGTSARLFLNESGGAAGATVRFRDATVASKLATKLGKGLGLAVRDFNGDGLTDIFAANDGMENFLWIQQPDGAFREEAGERGLAVNQMGAAEANMGVVCDDLNQDGLYDVFVTHLARETNTLWLGLPQGQFVDSTPQSGLGFSSLIATGFGAAALDVECDGDLDLLVANGHVTRNVNLRGDPSAQHDFWSEYADPNHLFLQESAGRYRLVERTFDDFSKAADVSRGLAIGDIDRDGTPEILVTNVAAPARLYRNTLSRQGEWLAVRAVDPSFKREAIGASIAVRVQGRWLYREILPHTSYLCSHDPVAFFGLGSHTVFEELVVEWPDRARSRERFSGGPANRYVTIHKGEGTPLPSTQGKAP